MSTLDGGELSFFQFQLPAEGMTIQLQVQQGRTVLYASSRIRNPSAALYDVRLETDSTADVYLDPSDFETPNEQGLQSLQKRQITDMFTNITLYVTIEGIQSTNFFTLETTFGDTCKFSSIGNYMPSFRDPCVVGVARQLFVQPHFSPTKMKLMKSNLLDAKQGGYSGLLRHGKSISRHVENKL